MLHHLEYMINRFAPAARAPSPSPAASTYPIAIRPRPRQRRAACCTTSPSSTPPRRCAAPVLVAVVEGRIWAALALDDERVDRRPVPAERRRSSCCACACASCARRASAALRARSAPAARAPRRLNQTQAACAWLPNDVLRAGDGSHAQVHRGPRADRSSVRRVGGAGRRRRGPLRADGLGRPRLLRQRLARRDEPGRRDRRPRRRRERRRHRRAPAHRRALRRHVGRAGC